MFINSIKSKHSKMQFEYCTKSIAAMLLSCFDNSMLQFTAEAFSHIHTTSIATTHESHSILF